jgi:hypothetical protein
LLRELADQLGEQQKLLADVAKKQNPDEPIKGFDLERMTKLTRDLKSGLDELKKDTEELRKQAEAKK